MDGFRRVIEIMAELPQATSTLVENNKTHVFHFGIENTALLPMGRLPGEAPSLQRCFRPGAMEELVGRVKVNHKNRPH